MAKGIARYQDICTGHGDGGCFWPPRPNNDASPDTMCNNRGIHCVSHSWEVHCACGECHDAVLQTGSNTVICNDKNVGRCGDLVSCGSYVASCSDDTFA